MLTIRMQRTGRSGHAQFRVVVQDSRFSPTSGRVVEYLGSYNPHSKVTTLDKDKAKSYLANGAQPSDRVAKLLKAEGVKLPDWVNESAPKKSGIRNQEKLRRNRPAEVKAEATPEVETPAEEASPAEETAVETEAPAAEKVTAKSEAPAEEAPATGEPTAETETPAKESPAEAEDPAA